MKKKLLNILLIGILIFGLSACGKESEKSNATKDKNTELIKDFLNNINKKNFDNAILFLDTENISELLKIDMPSEEFSNALKHSLNNEYNEIKYDIESIKQISKEDLLNEISKMDEKEILKNRSDIINQFDGYNLYLVKCTSSYLDEKINIHDVIFVNNNLKLEGSVFLDGIFGYYYGAVYNKNR